MTESSRHVSHLALHTQHFPSCVQCGEPLPKHSDEGDWDCMAVGSQEDMEVDPPLSEREDTTSERAAFVGVSMVA